MLCFHMNRVELFAYEFTINDVYLQEDQNKYVIMINDFI